MASTQSTPAASPEATPTYVASWRERFERELAVLDEQALRRRIVTPSSGQDRVIELDGESLINFTSNNYLGLATDPRLIEGAIEATRQYGASVSAARLLCGSTPLHDELERRLATLKEREACLLYGAGFLANVGVLSALTGAGDMVFSDELNHASIIDGCRISRAGSTIYRHCDMDDLERVLAETEAERRLIVTETVFSMDGDLTPLPELLEIAERYEAAVVIDEAHATGVLGRGGAGALSHFGIDPADLRVPVVVVGTLSKALGSSGGFVAADEAVISYLVNRSRSFIFSTALPPSTVGAALAALDVMAEEPQRQQHVHELAAQLRAGLQAKGYSTEPSETQIVPMMLGEAELALEMERRLRAGGVLARAIRPPTVPPGSSRIRFNLSAGHQASDVEQALAAVNART